MPRGYTDAMIQKVMAGNPENLGTQLGQLCINANLTPKGICDILGVQRATLRFWFLGGKICKDVWKVKEVMRIIKDDLAVGCLPALKRDDAYVYVAELKAFMDDARPPTA